MVSVKYDDLSFAFEFVSSAPPGTNAAYVSLDSDQIFWASEVAPSEEELPEDLETSDRYLAVPHKNDLDLGKNLALDFVAQELPRRYEQVEGFFRRRGAYARFKTVLETEGVLEKWYAFEEECTAKALKDWCTEHGIESGGS